MDVIRDIDPALRLRNDDARRAAQHETLRGTLEADVDRRISSEAREGLAAEPQVEAVASKLRHKAIREVEDSDRELTALRRGARVAQVLDYAFYLLYAFLGLRFLLGLMGANGSAGFVQLVRGVTQPFLAPFRNIVASPNIADTGSTVAAPILVAFVAYALLHFALRGLLRLIVQRQSEI